MNVSNVHFRDKHSAPDLIDILVFQFTTDLEKDWEIKDDNLYYPKETPQLKETVEKVLRKAVDKKVNLLVFPELSIPETMIPKIELWSRTNKITVIAGSHYERQSNGKPYNCCPVICNGETKSVRKTYPSKFEKKKISCSKNGLQIFRNTPIGDFCVFICSDYLFQGNDNLRSIALAEKLDFWIVPAFQPHAEEHHTTMSSDVRAHDDLTRYIVYCNNYNSLADGNSAFFGELHNDQSAEYKNKGITDYMPKFKAISPINNDWDYFIVRCSIKSKRVFAGSRIGDKDNIEFLEKGNLTHSAVAPIKSPKSKKEKLPPVSLASESIKNDSNIIQKQFYCKVGQSLTTDGFCTFNSKMRLPVSGSILLSKEVREIIDTPEFQRLRGVRQLGPTMFVFPGANHTRFEHSLGVYGLALKHIEKLTSLPEFHNVCSDSNKAIKLILLSALLHDLGHYPYSHWIEEIMGSLPSTFNLEKHEKRVQRIIENSDLKDILIKTWDIEPHELTLVITGHIKESRGDLKLVNSVINSVVDIDKLDYLKRDSIHCGINYGIGIDTERLMDSIHIDTVSKSVNITEKGLGSLMTIISARNIMYESVYWHKTVRAAEAMFKRCFYELSKAKGISSELESLLGLPDDSFIANMQNLISDKGLDEIEDMIKPFAFQGRKYLYKPSYVYFERNQGNNMTVSNYFNKIFDMNRYVEIVNESNALASRIRNFIPELSACDILIEKTPVETHENPSTQNFRIFNTRTKRHQELPSEIKTFNTYLNHNKQAYIFCSPIYYDKLLSLFQEDDILDEIFK